MDPLPPEVTDRIIDFLWADRASLRSCALTCRSWLPASRFHLFRTLRIWSREAFDALIHKSCIPETAEMFRFVQHLSIRERSGSFAHLVPHILVNKLPNVTSIDIHDFSVWAVSPDAGFFSILSRFKGVKALELRNVQFSTIHEMAILLCSFPSLSRLSLHSCNLIGDLLGPPVHLPPLRTLSLTHLTVDAGSMGIVTSELFLEWLLQTPTTRTLQTFKVVTGYLANVMAISGILTRLIHGLGDTLRAITISLSTSVDGVAHVYLERPPNNLPPL
ncbi:hypothetical protein OBBRIDRAFT_642089 [Obba rivulosa]|uniref:F-box domain-containing protein n=1 Tax=Obba rivulosa TaxID=1052685 RepID=A0A8E2DSN7_9APHY|nr:hypothetical protein OBBRIDRAFT_642089 [Obba rivulosa]